jgi:hypothetical protein
MQTKLQQLHDKQVQSFTLESVETNFSKVSKTNAICVATPLWPSVGVKPNTWKSWRLGVFQDSRMFRAR